MIQITDAAVEPISVTDFKTNTKVDGTGEDASTIPLYIGAARRHFEAKTDRILMTQTWEEYYDYAPSYVYIQKAPLQSVTHIKYLDEDDVEQTLATASYTVDTKGVCPRIKIIDKPTVSDKINNFWVRFVVGYGDASTDVPQDMIMAVTYMASHFYENRLPIVSGTVVNEVPMTFKSLTDPHRFYAIT